MTGKLIGAALLSLALAAPAQGASPKPVQLSKILLDVDNAHTIGSVKGGTMCVSSDPFVWGGQTSGALDYEKFESAFVSQMRAAKYSVASKTQNMFGDPKAEAADYLVGVNVLPREVRICLTLGGRIKGWVESDFEFKLYDTKTKSVVYETTVNAKADYPKFRAESDFMGLLREDFGAAVDKFALDPKVREYLGQPEG